MTIQRKFIFSVAALIIVIMLCCVWLTHNRTKVNTENSVQTRAQQLSTEVMKLLTITDGLMRARVDSTMNLMLARIANQGQIKKGQPVKVKNRVVPDLLINNIAQANNFTLVDELTKITGGTATLFSRDQNDFVRISTNVKIDGQRAIGTVLNPHGIVSTHIRKGKPFYGQVDILGTPYLTGYVPLLNSHKDTIGIAYVGYQADLSELENSIKDNVLLEQGFIAIVDDKNRIRMHSNNQSAARIGEVLSGEAPNWSIVKTPFSSWNYTVIVAYNRDDVADIVAKESITVGMALIFIGLLVIVLIVILVRAMVSTPLQRTIMRLYEITQGDGDLTRRFQSESSDELGEMARGFDSLLDQISNTIGRFSTTSQQLKAASNELNNISTRATEASSSQSEQTEQIAVSIDEMAVTAQNVAKNAIEAETVADTVCKLTVAADKAMADLVDSIEQQRQKAVDSNVVVTELKSASEDITTVLSVIEAIAEQTNLLALNAAIEAARAGEKGKGFAVVASEVRSLAGKTQLSTEKIQAMILRLQRGVLKVSSFVSSQAKMADVNAESAATTVLSLQQVLTAAERINMINAEIASAAEQQNIVTEEVCSTVNSIKLGAANSAVYAQETSQAGAKLEDFAKQAEILLSRYVV